MYSGEYLGNQRDPHLQKLIMQQKNPLDTIDLDERFLVGIERSFYRMYVLFDRPSLIPGTHADCKLKPDRDMYSASVLEIAALFCLFDDQLISLSPRKCTLPDVLR
nr:hypothetical protein [Tanacetum cinerariifolium]